ncbi:MAG TPA: DUF2382 domain-containing protein [Chryseosolibacter sp.]
MENQNDKDIVIPVIQEQVSVEKEVVTTASLCVSKTVEEVRQPLSALLMSESYDVQRVSKQEILTEAPDRYRQLPDRIIIPVVEEQVVVQKRLVLVEEIHLIRRETKREFHDDITLKKEIVKVERKPTV